MNLYFNGNIDNVKQGLLQLENQGHFVLGNHSNSICINVFKCAEGLSVKSDSHGQISLSYNKTTDFYRAVGHVLEQIKSKKKDFSISETSFFTDNGVMLDCSRNGVIKLQAVQKFLCIMSLMGLNMLQLYTEDTYEIPEYPYFGYMRGSYTSQELRAIDEYAANLGIEVVPCIQTLAHLTEALKWDTFWAIRDDSDVMLCDNEETYALIEAMIRQMASCYHSRRIHIGMDEAHNIGLGRYLNINGYQDRTELILRHLNKVVSICAKYGLKPMMWSDMFFRLATGGDYYNELSDEAAKIVREKIPEDLTLVYWDYYSDDRQRYSNMIASHQKITDKIAFAGGAWKWNGLLPDVSFSLRTTRAVLPECINLKMQTVFATSWGDNGSECAVFSILPTLQLYAEFGYKGENPTDEELSSRLSSCVGLSLNDFILLEQPNTVHGIPAEYRNPTKYLLYQDIPNGLFNKHVNVEHCPSFFAERASELQLAAQQAGQWKYMFNTAASLCHVLEIKSVLGNKVRTAYQNKDKSALESIINNDIPELQKRLTDYTGFFRTQWLEENKINGFEIIDIRLGGIKARLETLRIRLSEYLNGDICYLEEMDAELRYFDCRNYESDDIDINMNVWQRIVSPNVI